MLSPKRRIYGYLLSAGLLFGLWAAFSQSDEEWQPTLVPAAKAHEPTAIPDRIVLTWTGDPVRTQAVTWRTDASVKQAKAQIAVAEAGPKFVRRSRSIAARTTTFKSDLSEANYHSAVFEGLQPETKYVYRVGDGANWSAWNHFTTASAEAKPFSFIYFGDAQNDLKMHWSRVIRESFTDAPKARFMIHAGDLINVANRDAEWGDWFEAGGWMNATMPSIPTPGNHEYYREGLKSAVSKHWRPQFTLPENGPAGLEETVYFIDYQGVRFVSLNSNEAMPQQMPWLEKVLGDNPNRWTILTFHHPVYSAAKGRDNPRLRTMWQPTFDKYKVDLVLTGHDHTYGRSGMIQTNLPAGLNVRDGKTGTVYVVSVSGPKHYDISDSTWMKKRAEGIQLYQIIHIDGDRLRYEARTAVGDLFDAFELKKGSQGINEMVELPTPPLRETPREAAENSQGRDLFNLLGNHAFLMIQKSVQEELKLSKDQVARGQAFAGQSLRGRRSLEEMGDEERRVHSLKLRKQDEKALRDFLQPEQYQRLVQIGYHSQGVEAFSMPEVIQTLQLTTPQKDKVEGLQREAGDALWTIRQNAKGDLNKAWPEVVQLRRAASEKALAILITSQQAAWKAIAGEPFDGTMEFGRRD